MFTINKNIEKDLEEDLQYINIKIRKIDLKNVIYDLKTKVEEYKNHEDSSHPAMQSIIKYTKTLYENLESQLNHQ